MIFRPRIKPEIQGEIEHPWKGALALLLTIYGFAYGLILVNPGIFWDDWTIYHNSYSGLQTQFIGYGMPLLAPIHYFLQNLTSSPGLLYHALTFIIYLIASCYILFSLSRLRINKIDAILISIIIAVLPFNYARIYMICFPYTMGYLFVSAGLYYFIIFYKTRINIYRFVALFIMLLAYILLNSSLVFIPTLIVLIFLNENKRRFKPMIQIKMIFCGLFRLADFFVLPFLFWLVKNAFWKPIELYEYYNKVTEKGLLVSVEKWKAGISDTLIALFERTVTIVNKSPILSMVAFIICIVLIRNVCGKNRKVQHCLEDDSIMNDKGKLFIVGAVLFIAGLYPYLVVGHAPSFNYTLSRHQILLGIGTAMMIYSISNIVLLFIKNEKIRTNAFIALVSAWIAVFMIINIMQSTDALRAYFYHEAVAVDLKKMCGFMAGKNILYEDDLRSAFWKESLRFYTLTGIYRERCLDQSALILPRMQKRRFDKGLDQRMLSETYNTKDVIIKERYDFMIKVVSGPFQLSSKNLMKIIYYKLINKDKMNSLLENITNMKIQAVEK